MRSGLFIIYSRFIRPALSRAIHVTLRYPSVAVRLHNAIAKWPRLHQFLLGVYAERLPSEIPNKSVPEQKFEQKLEATPPLMKAIFDQLKAVRERAAGG
jgi:hypothetical protein